MIRINLALRKQSAAAGDGAKSGGVLGAGVGRIDIRLDAIKDLPVKKLAAALLAGFVASYFLEDYKQAELAKVDAIIGQLRGENSRLQAQVAKIRGFEAVKKQLEADEFVLRTKIETIEKLVADRQTPPKLLVALSSSVPSDVWFSSIQVKDGQVTLAGASTGFNQISDLMKNMNENIYFTDLTLQKTEQVKDDSGRDVAQFELTAKRR